MKGFRYLNDGSKERFLNYSYLALKDQFCSRENFDNYFNSIKTKERKDRFLKAAIAYLFLVKQGDWVVNNIPDSNNKIDYLTNTYKYITIFSLIEFLSEEKFIDFYQFLTSKNQKVEFPIRNKNSLEGHYRIYKEKFGSIKRCISFFKALSEERQRDLISKLKVEGVEATIENLAKFLYDQRSKFVHESELVMHMSEGKTVEWASKKQVTCELSITDAMTFFEEGLILHFREMKQIGPALGFSC